jgi:conjugative transfer region protein TrbK
MGKDDLILTSVASLLVGVLIATVVRALDTPDHIDPPPKGGYVMLGFDAPFLKRELRRCQQIGIAAYDDTQCQMAWMVIRGQPDACADFSVIGAQSTRTTSPSSH